jgi:hypothetical protein
MLGLIKKLDRISKLTEQEVWNYAVQSEQIKRNIIKWVNDQLDAGLNADDKIIGIYTLATQKISKGRKKAGTPYNLEDTGMFRESIGVIPNEQYIAIVANGQKLDENILDKYSIRVIELNEKHLNLLRAFILNEYQIYVRHLLQDN